MCGVRGQVPDLAVSSVGNNSDNDRGESGEDGLCSVRRSFWWQEKGRWGGGQEVDSQGVADHGRQGRG